MAKKKADHAEDTQDGLATMYAPEGTTQVGITDPEDPDGGTVILTCDLETGACMVPHHLADALIPQGFSPIPRPAAKS